MALGEWDEERDAALDKDIDATVRAAQKEAEKQGILPGQGFDNIGSMAMTRSRAMLRCAGRASGRGPTAARP